MKDEREPVSFCESVMAVIAIAWIIGMPYVVSVLRLFG